MEIYQGNLKNLSVENYEKFKKVILELGVSAPFILWINKGHHYILDGTQRKRTLTTMRDKEGYRIPKLPYVSVEAKNAKEAKKKILALTSQYGNMTNDGLYEFMSQGGLKWNDVKGAFSFPEVNMEKFKVEFYADPESDPKEKDLDENIETENECPKCKYRW